MPRGLARTLRRPCFALRALLESSPPIRSHSAFRTRLWFHSMRFCPRAPGKVPAAFFSVWIPPPAFPDIDLAPEGNSAPAQASVHNLRIAKRNQASENIELCRCVILFYNAATEKLPEQAPDMLKAIL